MGVWISRGNFISLLYKACAVSLYTILVRKIGGHFVTLFFNMSQNDLKLPNRILLIFSAIHIKSFAFRFATPITEWYSVEDLTEKFGMATSAIYSFVSRFAIPKKKIKRQVFYSKKHVDIAKGLAKAEPEYYTTAEAMEKYNLTRDQLYHYVKWHHISKVQEGKYIKISRKELDDLLAPPSI